MITPQTPAEFENALAIKQAQAAVHYAVTQNECYRAFWSRDPQEILDSINTNIPLTMQRFLGNTALGEAVNAQLANTPFTERCITVMPEGYSFNGTAFIFAQPEPIEND